MDRQYKQLRYSLKLVLLDVEQNCELWKEYLRKEGILVVAISDKLKEEISLFDIIQQFGVGVCDCLFITKEEKNRKIAQEFGVAVIGCIEDGFEPPKTNVLLENLEEISVSYLNLAFCHANGLPAVIVETKRCYIRELTKKDVPILYEILNEKEVVKFLLQKSQEKEEIEKLMAYVSYVYSFFEYAYWGIFLKDTNELIGRAGFQEGSWPLEAGYVIKHDFWGNGLATEVLSELLVYGEEELGCQEFFVKIAENNRASIRVAEKCGFYDTKKEEILYGEDKNQVKMKVFHYLVCNELL